MSQEVKLSKYYRSEIMPKIDLNSFKLLFIYLFP